MRKFPYPQELEQLTADVDLVLRGIEEGQERGDFDGHEALALQMSQGLTESMVLRKIQYLLEQVVWLLSKDEA